MTPSPTKPPLLRSYAQLVRLPNLFTAMADVAMGALVLWADSEPRGYWVVGLLMAASACLYATGVVLNDLCDLAWDRRHRPERPLPAGHVPLSVAQGLGWGLLVLGVGLAWLAGAVAGNFRPGLVALLLAVAIVGYNVALKPTVVGPLVMGGCRLLNVLLGMSAASGVLRNEHWLVALAIGVYVAGVSWFARRETEADHRGQLAWGTGLMLLGIALLAALPTVTAGLLPVGRVPPYRWYLLVAVLGGLSSWRCAWAVISPSDLRVQSAVVHAIFSLVIIDAAVCLAFRGMAAALLVMLLIVPAMVAGAWVRAT